jgi:plasmid replication initiation protein
MERSSSEINPYTFFKIVILLKKRDNTKRTYIALRCIMMIETIPPYFNDKTTDLVVKSNALIESSYKLGVNEHKLVRFVASKIKKEDADFKTYTLSVKEFKKAINLKGKSFYEELEKISADILKKPLKFKIGEKIIHVPWFSYIAYNPGEGTLDIRFDKFFKPYLLNLKEKFTKYNFKYISTLKSNYSIRLYELLKQRESIGIREFSIDELKELLCIEDLYHEYSNFKKRVILSAQKELKEKSDIFFEFQEIKKSRKVIKVKFYIHQNHMKKVELFPLPLEEETKVDFIKNIKKKANSMDIFLNDEIIETWEKYGEIAVYNALEQVSNREDIYNPAGYINTILQNFEKNELDEVSDVKENAIKAIIKEIKKRYSNTTEPIPDYIIQADFNTLLHEKLVLDFNECKDLWEQFGNEIVFFIKEKLQINRSKLK